MSRIKTFFSLSLHIPFETLSGSLRVLIVLAMLTTMSHAQSNFTVLHTFTGPDGRWPDSALTLDRYGNLYGTASEGGISCAQLAACGTVYELRHVNGSWIFNLLHKFTASEGYGPWGVTIGSNGTLYGATRALGSNDDGTLFNVTPPANFCRAISCPWNDTTLYSFQGGSDSSRPYGNVVFDSQGNLYGTSLEGGYEYGGTVYQATLSGGNWNETVLHTFQTSGGDGYAPYGAVVLDSAGNLYGTTASGGAYGYGTVYELSPSQGGWVETILHSFTGRNGEGCFPTAAVVFDQAGNLYGTTNSCGIVFELSPQSGGGWNFTTIYTFSDYGNGPRSGLAIDSAGNLYGTLPDGGIYAGGNVFELSPSNGGGWTYTDLYDFTGGNDGGSPAGGVFVTGPGGYLYGTTYYGGADDDGIIYEINLGVHH